MRFRRRGHREGASAGVQFLLDEDVKTAAGQLESFDVGRIIRVEHDQEDFHWNLLKMLDI